MFESVDPLPRKSVHVWTTIKLAKGKQWWGWRAGPTVGVQTHHLGGTVGCRAALTGGALRCGLCEQLRLLHGDDCVTTTWKGYIPMYDEAGVEHVAIICETYKPLAETVKLHGYCVVTKTLNRGCPLRVDPRGEKPLPVTLSEGQRRPQDIKAWMLRVWRDPELAAWCMKHAHAAAPAVGTAEQPAKPEGKPAKKRGPVAEYFEERIRSRIEAPPGDGPFTIGEVIDHNRNGHPRKPK